MKKTALATVILMLAFSFAWAADPGDWTYGSGNPSLISFAMLDVASLEPQTFVGVGIYQGATIDLAWKSTNGGLNLYKILTAADVGGFSLLTTVDFFDENHGVIGGIDFFAGLKAGLWVTDGAGEPGTWGVVDHGFQLGLGSSVDFVDAATETFGVALGYPNFILATHDAGATWDMLNSPVSGDDASLNAASFIDENIGFLATGYEPTDKSAPATPEEIRHRTLMRISPLYRFVHDGGMKSAKAVRKEGIYKTTDGGQTWVELVADMVWLPYRLSMANEQYGAVLTNEASGHSNYGIRYTDDGGATWNAGTVPDSVPWVPAANYNLGDIWMVDADLGYASAFYGIGGLPMGGAFLVTTDGGNTWDWDASGSTGSGYMGLDGEKKAHGAAGGVGLSNATWQGGANSGPTADAGEDGTGVVGEPFVLDGTGSADPEGDTLMHKWTLLSGPDLELVTPFGETLDVVPQTAGTYEFELLVSDSEFTDTDTVTFTIDDEPVTDDDDDDAADDDDDDGDDDGGDDDSDDDEASGGCGC